MLIHWKKSKLHISVNVIMDDFATNTFIAGFEEDGKDFFTNFWTFIDFVFSLLCRRSLSMKIDNQGDWGILPNKQNRIRCTPMHCLPICERPKISFKEGDSCEK